MNVRDGWWLFKSPKDCERLMILAAILTLVLSPQVAAAAPQTSPIVRLESHRGGFATGDHVEISFYLMAEFQGDASWRVRLKRDYYGPPSQSEQLDRWIDGGDCPGVALAADALREFQAPKASGPGEAGQAATMAPHGTRYVLTTVGAANGGEGVTVTTDLTGLILGEAAATTLSRLRACISVI